jgi:hypothetical protein
MSCLSLKFCFVKGLNLGLSCGVPNL